MISNSLPFFHPYVSFSFLFFFPLAFCPLHTYTIVHILSFFFFFTSTFQKLPHSFFFFFFPLLPLDSRSSPALSFFFFSFPTWFHKFSSPLNDTWFHNLAYLFGVIIFKVQTHTDTHGERRNRLCSTTPPPLLLLLTVECMQPGVISASFFFLDHLLLF